MNDYLDPATLTPESLYKLQSETWAQGAEAEQERIIKLITAAQSDAEHYKYGSLVWTQDIIALIKGEQK